MNKKQKLLEIDTIHEIIKKDYENNNLKQNFFLPIKKPRKIQVF